MTALTYSRSEMLSLDLGLTHYFIILYMTDAQYRLEMKIEETARMLIDRGYISGKTYEEVVEIVRNRTKSV